MNSEYPVEHNLKRGMVVTVSYFADDGDDVKTKMIPAKTGTNGTISRSFRKYLSNIP